MSGGGILIRGFHEEVGSIDLTADKLGRDLIVQPPEHYMTHEGKHFTLSHYFADIDADGYGRIRFKTPADKYLHAVFWVYSTAGLNIAIYRTPGFTHNASNAITAFNKNDDSEVRAANPDPLQEACHTPSGSGSGTQFTAKVPVGTGGNPARVGPGFGRDANEVILDIDTVYLIEAQSMADNNVVAIGTDFYWRSA